MTGTYRHRKKRRIEYEWDKTDNTVIQKSYGKRNNEL